MTRYKRTIRSRLRGLRTCGYGSRKKHRGKGSTGGNGMAGTGKKSTTKLTWLLKYYPNYLGRKKGFTSMQQKGHKKFEAINLDEINKQIEMFKQKGMLKGKELNLKGYKVLSSGELKEKLTITASAFSENAIEKIRKNGSEIIKVGE